MPVCVVRSPACTHEAKSLLKISKVANEDRSLCLPPEMAAAVGEVKEGQDMSFQRKSNPQVLIVDGNVQKPNVIA